MILSPGRHTCPKCGGVNTLVVNFIDGMILWNCFRAKCSNRGAKVNYKPHQTKEQTKKVIPVVPEELSGTHLNYLKKYNSLDAYLKQQVTIYYDPDRDRLLFGIYYEGQVINFIGKSLRGDKPKWLYYSSVKNLPPFMVDNKAPQAVLVEDCLSACAVSRDASWQGVALLGTNLSDFQCDYILMQGYKKILVMLDPDATNKAVKIATRLNLYVPTRAVPVPADPKDMDPTQIDDFLERN